jgi:hypothetical protein
LDFVLNRIDRLYGLDQQAARTLEALDIEPIPREEAEKLRFRTELRRLRSRFDEVLAGLRKTRAELELPGSINPLAEAIATVVRDAELTAESLRGVFAQPTEEQRSSKARELLFQRSAGVDAFSGLATELEKRIYDATVPAAEDCQDILGRREGGYGEAPFADAAVEAVRHYYESYDHYDMISYPILYPTEVGEESDAVDVLRVSPEDATSLINERNPNERRRKLAGTSSGYFGVFPDRWSRRNDILWGRLDGAERIISALLRGTVIHPAHQELAQQDLIREAQLRILHEETSLDAREHVIQLLANVLANTDRANLNEHWLKGFIEDDLETPISRVLETALLATASDEELLYKFRTTTVVNQPMNRLSRIHVFARSLQVIGKMAENILDEYEVEGLKKFGTRLVQFAKVFGQIVDVVVPNSIPNLLFRNRIKLLYLFELFLITGGTVLKFGDLAVSLASSLQKYGLVALVGTAAVHFSVLALADWIRGKGRKWGIAWRVFLVAVLITLLILALVGVDALFDLRGRLSLFE